MWKCIRLTDKKNLRKKIWTNSQQRVIVGDSLRRRWKMDGDRCTMGQNNQGYRLEYWATRSSFRSLLAPLTRSLTHFAHSLVRQWMIRWVFFLRFFQFWPIVRWMAIDGVPGAVGVKKKRLSKSILKAPRTPSPPASLLHVSIIVLIFFYCRSGLAFPQTPFSLLVLQLVKARGLTSNTSRF